MKIIMTKKYAGRKDYTPEERAAWGIEQKRLSEEKKTSYESKQKEIKEKIEANKIKNKEILIETLYKMEDFYRKNNKIKTQNDVDGIKEIFFISPKQMNWIGDLMNKAGLLNSKSFDAVSFHFTFRLMPNGYYMVTKFINKGQLND